MTILADRPTVLASVDLAGLAAEVEAFITYPVPYELGTDRARLRGDARTAALAHLLGGLTDLIESDRVSAETVVDAIRTALRAGTDLQHQYLTRRRTDT